jgi:molybdate transport system substrate-binding protein
VAARVLPLILVLACACGGAAAPAARGQVIVSAAVSLTEVMQQIAAAYEAGGGDRMVLNLAASNTLARQIASGARVDVFISADEAQMDRVKEDILPQSRIDLLSNQLAIAVSSDRARRFASVQALADPSIRRLAIGDPAAVPAGVYARLYLRQAGLWSTLEPRLVPAASVRLALAAVENGAADAAIVYRTDIPAARRAREAFVVPFEDGPRIVYPAAAIRGGGNAAGARRLLAFLQGAEAAAIFARAGFRPLR